MADRIIKTFTIGDDVGRVDYDALANKPAAPVQATVNWADTNIKSVSTYKYFCTERQAEAEAINAGAKVYARDEEFGFPTIDGSGQVNLGVELASGYDVVSQAADPATAYTNFKTPYLTCHDNVYRFTKVTEDFATTLAAAKESDMEAYTVNFVYTKPEDYTGDAPVVKEYRTNEAMLYRATTEATEGYKPVAIDISSGTATSKTYSKDSGYPDKSATSTTEGDAAQSNFTVDWTAPTGSGYTLTVTSSTKVYKNFKHDTANGYQMTKVFGNPTINITIAAPVNVTYVTGSYTWSKKEEEAPVKAAKGQDFTCYFYTLTSELKPSTAVSDEDLAKRIASVTIGGTAYTGYTLTNGGTANKKSSLTIPGSAVTGDIVITLAMLEGEEVYTLNSTIAATSGTLAGDFRSDEKTCTSITATDTALTYGNATADIDAATIAEGVPTYKEANYKYLIFSATPTGGIADWLAVNATKRTA